MTLEKMNELSKSERDTFLGVTCHTFDASQSLEEYTVAIRDFIYIWRHIEEGRVSYTFESVNKNVKNNAVQIKAFYCEKAPVDDAAVDVDYCCG